MLREHCGLACLKKIFIIFAQMSRMLQNWSLPKRLLQTCLNAKYTEKTLSCSKAHEGCAWKPCYTCCNDPHYRKDSRMEKKKIRIGLIFGGRSGEHEVSLASAESVMANLDRDKYEIVPIGITKEGSWLLGTELRTLRAAEPNATHDTGLETTTAVTLTGDPRLRRLIPVENGEELGNRGALDVIFPVLHGPYGEDGALQGLLEMANVPYVGCGVLGSALGMDKEKMKLVFQAVGLPVAEYLVYRRNQWERSPEIILDAVEQQLGFPCFVKPVNLGSSVGVNKAHDRIELEYAINVAADYDHKIIIERGINCREVECGVLGNDEPIASVV